MVDSANVEYFRPISSLKWSPPVAPAQEFVCQSQPQFRVFRQVADLLNTKLVSADPGHHEGVCVVESEFLRNAYSVLRQLLAQSPNRRCNRTLQNLLLNRSCVIRVGCNRPLPQRLPQDDCSAHALAMLDMKPGFLHAP